MPPVPPALPVSVKGVVINADRVLLVHNDRDEWELPGGRIEPGESPQECVVREIHEESRWEVEPGPILDSWVYEVAAASRSVLIVTYGCFPLSDVEPVHSHEHDGIGLFDRGELAGLRLPEGYRRSIAAWFPDPRRRRPTGPTGAPPGRRPGRAGRSNQ